MIRVASQAPPGPRPKPPAGLLIAASVAWCSLTGCTNNRGEAQTVGPEEPARRAATSFVHCVEAEGGGCVLREPKQGSWDAFAMLSWMGAGSPTSILLALRRELEHHRDPFAVQDRFVTVASRYRESLRGAECQPDEATPLTELLPKLVGQVESRMQSLGLWREDLQTVVESLAGEATRGLEDGWLVHMSCYGDPYEIWVATAKDEERQVVVGLLTTLPSWLGGGPLDDEHVEDRVQSRTLGAPTTLGVIREGTVDSAWMPIPIEEF